MSGFPGLDMNLNQTQKVQANLQKAIGQIYSRKAYDRQSDWYKNDPLLDRMYELLTILTERLGGEFIIYAEPDLTITFPEKVLSQRSWFATNSEADFIYLCCYR